MNDHPTPAWRNRNVLILALVSLLNDAASDMVVPLLPAFLLTIGAGAFALGWIEGSADLLSGVLKWVAGTWADRTKRYLPFVLVGYLLATVARPFLAIATTASHVLCIRLVDRTGKGLRSAPRDAVLAASVPREQRGAAFGFHRAMDHLGAVIGPLLAALALFAALDLRAIFLLALIPGGLAVALVAFGVRAPTAGASARPEEERADQAAPADANSRRLLRFLAPLALFTLGNASDAFLLLKAGVEDTPLTTLPLLWMALHVVKSLTSLAGGRLADRWGRRRTIVLGWSLYVVIYIGFALAESQLAFWVLFIAYGAHHGLSEAPEKALVSDVIAQSRWGGGFGAYYMTVGGLSFVASILFGGLWAIWGAATAFLTSASIAACASLVLLLLVPEDTANKDPR